MATVPEEATTEAETHRKPPFLRRVRIRNYKSIKFCDVTLEPLTVLVGRNGSGKSNFVDALAFLRDVVTWGTEKAVDLHGGPTIPHGYAHDAVAFEIEYVIFPLAMRYPGEEAVYRYSIEISDFREQPRVLYERFFNVDKKLDIFNTRYAPDAPPSQVTLLSQRLGESLPLRTIRDYNFDPRQMRQPRRDVSGWLAKSGENLASVFFVLMGLEETRAGYRRVQDYLKSVVSEIKSVDAVQIADHYVIRFQMGGSSESVNFYAASMSDGTLRALATLVAAFQSVVVFGPPDLVAIEEPETSLHPAAMHALVDALDEATGRTQILLTTHSTELLDNPTVRPENVRVVEMVNGETVITPVDEASVEIVKQHLDTLGGLERQNQLSLNLDDQDRQRKLAAGSDVK